MICRMITLMYSLSTRQSTIFPSGLMERNWGCVWPLTLSRVSFTEFFPWYQLDYKLDSITDNHDIAQGTAVGGFDHFKRCTIVRCSIQGIEVVTNTDNNLPIKILGVLWFGFEVEQLTRGWMNRWWNRSHSHHDKCKPERTQKLNLQELYLSGLRIHGFKFLCRVLILLALGEYVMSKFLVWAHHFCNFVQNYAMKACACKYSGEQW